MHSSIKNQVRLNDLARYRVTSYRGSTILGFQNRNETETKPSKTYPNRTKSNRTEKTELIRKSLFKLCKNKSWFGLKPKKSVRLCPIK